MSQTKLTTKTKSVTSKKRPKPDTEDEGSSSEHDSLSNNSLLSNTPPSAKKQKKTTALKPKKSTMGALQEVQNEAFDGGSESKPKKSTKATDQYQKVRSFARISASSLVRLLIYSSLRNWSTSSSDQTRTSVRWSVAKSRCGFITLKGTQWR